MESRTLKDEKKSCISQLENLRRWREAIGLSQENIARMADVSQAHVSEVESGLATSGKLEAFLQTVERRRDRYLHIQ